jgi:hypothetical protein
VRHRELIGSSRSGVSLEVFQRYELESMNVGCFENDGRSFACFKGLNPTSHAEAPVVAWFQTWEIVLLNWGGKVIAALATELEELSRCNNTNGVKPLVIRTRAAESVAIKARHR